MPAGAPVQDAAVLRLAERVSAQAERAVAVSVAAVAVPAVEAARPMRAAVQVPARHFAL